MTTEHLNLRTQRVPIFSLTGAVVLISFMVGHFIQGHPGIAMLDLAILACVAVTFSIHRRTNAGNWASGTGLSFLMSGLLLEIHVSGLLSGIWFVIFPIPVFSILGARAGRALVIGWAVVLTAFLFTPNLPPPAETGEKIQVILGFLAGAMMAYRQEQLRAEQVRKIKTLHHMAEVANRAKSRFLTQVSHDLRTPLNAILGFSQLLEQRDSLSTEDREMVGKVIISGRKLLDLVNRILAMSRQDLNDQDPEMDGVDFDMPPTPLSTHLPIHDFISELEVHGSTSEEVEKVHPDATV